MKALSFLQEKGLPYGHLHTGNILLTPTCAKLLDVENGLLGLPAFYRPYVVQRRKLHATVSLFPLKLKFKCYSAKKLDCATMSECVNE